ncbi:Reverse transcriptase zinc-binding domain [Sesbania bispinosa]|nr:Reverse transcriptase zinc-binding domain [Sesbania bispinosa]
MFKVLFQNDSPATLLARVIGIVGPIDQSMLAKGRDTYKYFTKNHMLYERNQRNRKPVFRFENAWLEEPGLDEVVRLGWGKEDHADVLQRIKSCTEEMNQWGKKLRLKYRAAIQDCKRSMEELRESNDEPSMQRRIRVFRDPWLKNRSNSFITSNIPEGYEDLRVEDLIDSNLACWRTNLIRSVFHPEEAVAILDTPLSSCSRDDELIWKLSRDGKFSVKSAYFHVSESLIDNSHLIVRGDWSLLWRLRIPNRAKLLMWRVLRGCLPVRTNLQRREVKCPATCPLCEEGLENEFHAFYGCRHNIQCWKESGCWREMETVVWESEGYQEATFHLLRSSPLSQKREFVLMVWALWKQRNIKVWEGELKSVQDTTWHAKETLEEWEKAHKRPNDMHDTQGWVWIPPQPNRVKCNVDAALFSEERSFGVGLCLRDDQGRFIKAKKGTGLLEAINWLEELGVQAVDIELDCKVVVEAVQGDKTYVNELE